jgi:hypothetical protein
MCDFFRSQLKVQFPQAGKNRKVAGILRSCSCGVKRKYTIPSGAVAERFFYASLTPMPGLKNQPGNYSFLLYNLAMLAHNLSFY